MSLAQQYSAEPVSVHEHSSPQPQFDTQDQAAPTSTGEEAPNTPLFTRPIAKEGNAQEVPSADRCPGPQDAPQEEDGLQENWVRTYIPSISRMRLTDCLVEEPLGIHLTTRQRCLWKRDSSCSRALGCSAEA